MQGRYGPRVARQSRTSADGADEVGARVFGGCSHAVDEHAAAWTYGTPHHAELGRKSARLDTCNRATLGGTDATKLLNLGPVTKRCLLGLTAVSWDSEHVSGTPWTARDLSLRA